MSRKLTVREKVYGYVKRKYGSEPEYLWRRFPDYAIFRHEDNRNKEVTFPARYMESLARLQSEQALKSGLSFQGKPIEFKLTDEWGWPIPEENLYKPYFGPRCLNCGMRLTCNGCSRCGKCKGPGSADTFS